MALTAEQKLAIDTRHRSILLNAGAGSGKTHVLTERVVTLLEEGSADAGELLVLTFTKAAAQEMKNRITSKLAIRREQAETILEQDPGNTEAMHEAQRLQHQLVSLPAAAIQTIDSFCSDVVRDNHALVGLPGTIRLIPELVQAGLKDQILTEILTEELETNEAPVEALLRQLGGVEQAKDEIRRFSTQIQSYDDREQWLRQILHGCQPDQIQDSLDKTLVQTVMDLCENLVEAADFFRNDPEQSAKSRQTLQKASDVADRVRQELVLQGISDTTCIPLQALPARTPVIKAADGEALWQKKRLADTLKLLKGYTDLPKLCQEQQRRLTYLAPVLLELIHLSQKFDLRYSQVKKERGLIDFADMEIYALQILQIPMISDLYKKRFRHIFVDEYQDTNPLQEKIIESVADRNNLFCVGDMKQSIYRFRSADPLLFRDRSQRYREDPSQGLVINLSRNFRSTTNILMCCDDIFSVLAGQSEELEYGEADRLQVGRTVQGEVKPTLIISYQKDAAKAYYEAAESDTPMPDEQVSALNDGEKAEDRLESEAIAGFILKRMQQDIFDASLNEGQGGLRPCRYSDFAVIARKRTEFQSSLMEVLRSHRIPYAMDKAGPLLKSLEAEMLFEILGLAVGFETDISMQNMIHAGFFGFTDQDLVDLHLRRHNETLLQAARKLASASDGSQLSEKCAELCHFLQEVQQKDSSGSLYDLIGWAAERLDLAGWCIAKGDGVQRLANVEKIRQTAQEYQRDGRNRLHAFLQAVKAADPNLDSIDSASISADPDSVLLTTIHGSKGMQYPIVIIPFTGTDLERSGRQYQKAVFCHESGHPEKAAVALPYYDPDLQVKGSTLIYDRIRRENREKEFEEERRLLYVAMTRAEEELVITGSQEKNETGGSSLMKWIQNALSQGNLRGQWQQTEATDYIVASPPKIRMQPLDLGLDPAQFAPEEDNQPILRDDFPVPAGIGASRAVTLLESRKSAVDPLMGTDQNSPFVVRRDQASLEEDPDHAQAAQRGTRLHSFMENVDFSRILEEGYAESLAASLLKEHAAEIDGSKIRALFSQPEGQLIIQSQIQIREKPASLSMPYSQLDSRYAGEAATNLFAVMDLVVRKDGQWYLFDYKSDRIQEKPGTAAFERELARHTAHHSIQMELYRRILQEVFGIEIEASWLAYTDISRFVPVYQKPEREC